MVRRRRGEEWKGYFSDAVYLSGFSLGAGVVLKALGEMGELALTEYGVRGAAVSDAPYDVELNNPYLETPLFNQIAYITGFLNSMKGRCHDQLVMHCDGNVHTRSFDYI